MLLYDSFLALHAETLTTTFQGIVIKRSDMDLATKKAVASYRCLSEPSKISAYQAFLRCCEQALHAQDEVFLLDVMISFLSESDELNQQDACNTLTQLFNRCFERQHDALSIASMGLCFVDRPRAFVSFICYLLQHAVTPEEILATHLLHNYFRYYLSSLSQAHNAIQELYELFGFFEEAAPLVRMASEFSCGERGFDAYALNGCIQRGVDELPQVELVISSIRFTVDEVNLKTLHALFHENFLIEALCQWRDHSQGDVWVNGMTDLFNRSDVVLTQLPLVVERAYDHPLLLQALARILNEQSLSVLVDQHVVGILSLTPLCPELIEMIQTHELSSYLHALKQQQVSGPALFSCLFTLFNCTKEKNIEFSSLIFDALLDAIDLDPCVLEDTIMIGKLRKFRLTDAWINKRVRALEDAFEITVQSQTQASIDGMDYICLYDAWSPISAKIRHLKEVMDFKTSFPMDKYMLYVRLAKAFIQQGDCAFDLPTFARALQIDPVFDAETITLYERFLLELLVMIDDETLRANCIDILDEKTSQRWLNFNYGGECLLMKAVRAGNLGLVQWVDGLALKSPLPADSLARIAVYNHHWSVVSYLHTHRELKQGTVNMLFEQAALEGRLLDIFSLWGVACLMPDTAVIEKAFQQSIEKNDKDNIRCLIACPKAAAERVIKKAFNMAIERKYFDIAIALAEGGARRTMQDIINQALRSAARLNQCDVLKVLTTLTVNCPAQPVIDGALIVAARAGHLSAIKCLVDCSINPPSLGVILSARDEARSKHRLDIEDYLLTMSCLQDTNHTVISGNDRHYKSHQHVHFQRSPLFFREKITEATPSLPADLSVRL